jgi:hypothetical protein
MVYVVSADGKPLMPCSNPIARILLKQGKAKVKIRQPFSIKLNYETKCYTQPITIGIDTGSKTLGAAAVTDEGRVVYLSEVEIRNDITGKMTQRASYRRDRRSRKTRYRKARWRNRKNSRKTDCFSPTMRSKIDSHEKEIRFIQSILPCQKIIVETGAFDTHALKNPEVLKNKWMYQHGPNYGYANTKAYVLYRDRHTCRHCGGKSKDPKLHVHHIIYRSNGGSNTESNLLTLCETCHGKVHSGDIKLKPKAFPKSGLSHATQMNSIRLQLLKNTGAEETFGFITKENRQYCGLPKEHYIDAVMIAGQGGKIVSGVMEVIIKKCVSRGDYRQTKGKRSEQRIHTGKIHGFRKYDKVLYRGKEYFIKGRMSTGYAILMSISGVAAKLKPIPKLSLMLRIMARKAWIIQAKTIVNIY